MRFLFSKTWKPSEWKVNKWSLLFYKHRQMQCISFLWLPLIQEFYSRHFYDIVSVHQHFIIVFSYWKFNYCNLINCLSHRLGQEQSFNIVFLCDISPYCHSSFSFGTFLINSWQCKSLVCVVKLASICSNSITSFTMILPNTQEVIRATSYVHSELPNFFAR